MKKKITDAVRPKTAIIYSRVSSKEQTLGYSLPNQEKADSECAKTKGLEIIKIFREEGESAKTADRTQLRLMMDYCVKNVGKIGYIIVWKVDRFSREQKDHHMLRAFFSNLGVELISATENLSNDPIGRASEGMLAVMAQYENDLKTERTITGMRAKAMDGRWPVGAPWGYVNTLNTLKKKIIIPHPERAPIVKFLFEEYARGTATFLDLANKVNAMGDIRSKHGKKISKQLVQKILKNPIHYGWIEIPSWGISVQGKHEAIISKEIYYEAQYLMEGGKSRKQPRNRNNPLFPLKGVLCGGCGGKFTGGKVKGKGGIYHYYSCMTKGCEKRTSINKDAFESEFTEFLDDKTPDPVLLEALEEAITIVHEKQYGDELLLSGKFEKRIQKLNEEMDELLRMRAQKEIGPEEYSRMSSKLKIEQREIELQNSTLVSKETSTLAAVSFGIRLVKEFPVCWPMLEPGELKVLRKLFFPKNLEYHYPKFKTPELAPIYTVESASTAQENHYVTPTGIEPVFVP